MGANTLEGIYLSDQCRQLETFVFRAGARHCCPHFPTITSDLVLTWIMNHNIYGAVFH